MDNIKVIAFDYDDTLVESLKAKWAQHKHVALAEYGKSLTDEEIRLNWTKPYSELITALYSDDDVSRATVNNKKYETNYPKTLFPDTIAVLERLHSSNNMIAIVSSTNASSLENDLLRFRFPADLLNYVQTEEITDFHKPDPRVFDPFHKWLDTHGIKSNQVLYVGDGLHDMNAAKGAGFSFIGITTGLITKEKFAEQGSASIGSLSDLEKYLNYKF